MALVVINNNIPNPIPAIGGEYQITIRNTSPTSVHYRAIDLASWITIEPTHETVYGNSDLNILVYFPQNTGNERADNIYFRNFDDEDDILLTIPVVQSGAIEIIHNIPAEIPANGGSYEIRIKNINPISVAWAVEWNFALEWLNASPLTGIAQPNNDGVINVTIEPSNILSKRNASINVTAGTKTEIIPISQQAQPSAKLIIPPINPIRFSLDGINEPQRADAFYALYFQKFQRSDRTMIQFLYDDRVNQNVKLEAFDEQGVFTGFSLQGTIIEGQIEGYKVVEFAINFSKFNEGLYWFKLTVENTNLTYKTGLICVKNEQPFTTLVSYRNYMNSQSVAFSTGIKFSLRVESENFNDLNPKATEAIYDNTLGQFQTLHSTPFDTFRLNIGGSRGIPDWLMSIVNRAFSCTELRLDGVRTNKIEGAEWEAISSENYNKRGWFIEVVQDEDDVTSKTKYFLVGQGKYLVSGNKIIVQ